MNLPIKKTAKIDTVTVPEIVEAQAKELITTADGLALLERHLKDTFPETKIRDYIKDLCEAEDIKMSKMGPYSAPNWKARKDGLDKVLELLRLKQVVEVSGQRVPTKVVFNTIIVGKDAKERAPKK